MQLKKSVEPFGEVDVFPKDGKTHVKATILMEPHKEGAQTGIALDGSGSMQSAYGSKASGGFLSSLVGGGNEGTPNEVSPVAGSICEYLARKVDADGGTTCIYWAVGPGGAQIEVIGDLRAEDAKKYVFSGPKDFGNGTQLLPAMKYFVERFKDALWGFYVFITDGELHDLEPVKQYTRQLATEIAQKKRNPLKFVLVGVGPNIQERQMEELDDLEADLDLWDHKIAKEMRRLEEIFAEVVDANTRVAATGKILDPQGNLIKDYSDTGVPPLLEFEIDSNAAYFTLDVNGSLIHQPLSDTTTAPESQINRETLKQPKPSEPITKDTVVAPGVTTHTQPELDLNDPANFDVSDEIARQKGN